MTDDPGGEALPPPPSGQGLPDPPPNPESKFTALGMTMSLPPPPMEAPPPPPPQKRKGVVIGLVVVAVLAAGVIAIVAVSSGGSKVPAPAGSGAVEVPTGWVVHRDADAGFAIAFPDSWADATDEAKGTDPSLSDLFKFAVVDRSGFGENVTVAQEQIPNLSVDDYADVSLDRVQDLEIEGFVKTSETLPAGAARVLRYSSAAGGVDAAYVQYLMVNADRAYVVTFAAPKDHPFDPSLIAQFMHSFETFD